MGRDPSRWAPEAGDDRLPIGRHVPAHGLSFHGNIIAGRRPYGHLFEQCVFLEWAFDFDPQRPRAFFAERNSHFTYYTLTRDAELTAEYDRAVQKTAFPDDPAVLAALHDSYVQYEMDETSHHVSTVEIDFTKLAANTNPDRLLAQLGRLPRLEFIALRGGPLTADGVAALSRCSALVKLSLPPEGIDEHARESFSLLDRVKVIKIWNGNFADDDLQCLAGMKALKQLELCGDQITGRGLTVLAQMKNLRDLSLSGRNLDDAALAGAATAPNLRSLYIWGANVGDRRMAEPASVTPPRMALA